MYPARYQLPALTAHLVGLLERRRASLETWDEAAETSLTQEARGALADAGKQFAELADDPAYWQRTEKALLSIAVPRYLKLARAQHTLELRRYNVWRGGDFVSRAAYAGIGLLLGLIIWRTPIPNWLEPLPLALFLGGPLIPDLQEWWARRRYARALSHLVDEMGEEQTDSRTYLPLSPDAPAPVDELTSNEKPSTPEQEREKNRE